MCFMWHLLSIEPQLEALWNQMVIASRMLISWDSSAFYVWFATSCVIAFLMYALYIIYRHCVNVSNKPHRLTCWKTNITIRKIYRDKWYYRWRWCYETTQCPIEYEESQQKHKREKWCEKLSSNSKKYWFTIGFCFHAVNLQNVSRAYYFVLTICSRCRNRSTCDMQTYHCSLRSSYCQIRVENDVTCDGVCTSMAVCDVRVCDGH